MTMDSKDTQEKRRIPGKVHNVHPCSPSYLYFRSFLTRVLALWVKNVDLSSTNFNKVSASKIVFLNETAIYFPIV